MQTLFSTYLVAFGKKRATVSAPEGPFLTYNNKPFAPEGPFLTYNNKPFAPEGPFLTYNNKPFAKSKLKIIS